MEKLGINNIWKVLLILIYKFPLSENSTQQKLISRECPPTITCRHSETLVAKLCTITQILNLVSS